MNCMKYYKITQYVWLKMRDFEVKNAKIFWGGLSPPQTPPNNEEGDTPSSNSSPQCRKGSNFLSFIPPTRESWIRHWPLCRFWLTLGQAIQPNINNLVIFYTWPWNSRSFIRLRDLRIVACVGDKKWVLVSFLTDALMLSRHPEFQEDNTVATSV